MNGTFDEKFGHALILLFATLAAVVMLGGCMMVPMGVMMAGGAGHGGHGGDASGMPVHAAIPELIAEQTILARCEAALARVIVSQDERENPREFSDRQAQVGVPPLVRIAHRLAQASGYFQVLDSDPMLFSLPGAVQPEYLLRSRLVSLDLAERSGIERTWDAARRRLGGEHAQAEAIVAAQIGLALVCPRERRVAHDVIGRSDTQSVQREADSGAAANVARHNQEQIAHAYARAQNAALAFLRANPQPCGGTAR